MLALAGAAGAAAAGARDVAALLFARMCDALYPGAATDDGARAAWALAALEQLLLGDLLPDLAPPVRPGGTVLLPCLCGCALIGACAAARSCIMRSPSALCCGGPSIPVFASLRAGSGRTGLRACCDSP